MGLAARYVSGYLETAPPPGEARFGTEASTPGCGLPARTSVGSTSTRPTTSVGRPSYVTTAWGRDYADVSPLKGVVFGGGDSQSLDVGVHMARVSPTA